ncbi:MAG: NAD(P)-binding domain-containing protein [Ktedonobacteraceae bacterium]|nr:NAD(P)-binding domain-containing protein [Ktedonobacteraceae bacterium]
MATEKQTIAVLGASNIGGTLGRKWVAAGHRVFFGVNDPNGKNAQSLRSDLGDKAVIGSVADALSNNPDVVELALPGTVVDEIISTYAKQLDGRIIIDSTNRMGSSTMNSFETLHKQTPNAQTFRAFNTYGAVNFANPQFPQGTASLFYCGPNGDARTKVEQLITDIGPEPVYIGGVDQVNVVDGVAQLWLALAFGQKRGPNFAFKILTRE